MDISLIETLKRQITMVCRLLHEKGLIAGADGNVSVKAGPEGPIVITPGGLHKGLIREQDLVLIDLSGKVIEGHKRPSSEVSMHLNIYSAAPQTRAVVHAHPPFTLALSLAGHDFSAHLLAEGQMILGDIPVVGYYPPGSDALANAVGKAARSRVCSTVLERHGAVTWASGLIEALSLMECLEHNSKITTLVRGLGAKPVPVRELLEKG